MNYILLLGIIISVIVIALLIYFVVKNTGKIKESSISEQCQLSKQMDFPDVIGSQKCVLQGNDDERPAFTLFIRHCDRGYKDQSDCVNNDPKKCYGCQHLESTGGCATNDCSTKGLERAWAMGKWVSCFAKANKVEIASVIGQKFEPGVSNMRPTTTATVIYKSLMAHGHTPCYSYGEKGQDGLVKQLVHDKIFNGKLVVVVWSHGALPELIQTISDKPNIYWDDCCFDQVAVMDSDKNMKVYNAKSLEDNDLCGTKCLTQDTFNQCTYKDFDHVECET